MPTPEPTFTEAHANPNLIGLTAKGSLPPRPRGRRWLTPRRVGNAAFTLAVLALLALLAALAANAPRILGP